MAEALAFGVGSLFFEMPGASNPSDDDHESDMSVAPEVYVNKVKSALEAIPSVDEVVVDEPTHTLSIYRYPWNPGPEVPPHSKGPHPGGLPEPNWGDGGIAFTVRIPKRMQEELQVFRRRNSFETDEFRVETYFRMGLPVTFVQPIGSTPPQEASSAIIIVRNFLEREFAQIAKGHPDVIFCNEAPSPLWVNCYVEPLSDAQKPIDFVFERSRAGYDKIFFRYSTAEFKDATEAFKVIKSLVTRDLSQYYSIRNQQRDLHHLWLAADAELNSLVGMYMATGLRAYLRRIAVGSRRSRRLSLYILRADAEKAVALNRATEITARIRNTSPLPAFLPYLERQLDEMSNIKPPQTSEMTSFLDSVNARSMEIVAVIASSVLGGIVGAGITALLSR